MRRCIKGGFWMQPLCYVAVETGRVFLSKILEKFRKLSKYARQTGVRQDRQKNFC